MICMHVLCIPVPKCQSDCKFVATSEGCPLSNWKFHRYLGLYTPVRQYIYIYVYPRVRTEYGIVHHPHREHDLDSRYWHLSFIHILNIPGWLQLDIGLSLCPFFSISYPVLSYPILSIHLSIFVYGKRYLHGHSPPKPLIFSDVVR